MIAPESKSEHPPAQAFRILLLVGHEQDGGAGLLPFDSETVGETAAQVGIERGKRFVKQEKVTTIEQGARKGNAAFHTAR